MKRRFYQCCVNWPEKDVPQLSQMIEDARDISRRTFLRHIHRPDLDDLAAQMSYAKHPRQGLTLAADWAVSYHRSKLHGQRVYYFRHSAIEYVFI